MENENTSIHAIKIHQWLDEWKDIKLGSNSNIEIPKHFYMFSMSARHLKKLSDIRRRSPKTSRNIDLGIQRRHDVTRSNKIAEYIRYGYPWSDLSKPKRASGEYNDLRKPGWLPTAIVLNVLIPKDRRLGNRKVLTEDLVTFEDLSNGISKVKLPDKFYDPNWEPVDLYPFEVIDGQHRLWAFEDPNIDLDYELPVVAFQGLDISLQAYLFWTININPVRISQSFAFDLYPLLRTEDWLTKVDSYVVYKQTRAQELVEVLWSNPQSAWYQKINMLGEPGLGEKMVTQAAWVRSLTSTYIKTWDPESNRIGGLFGAPLDSNQQVLPWSRAQQAAFLVFMGQSLKSAVNNTDLPWAQILRKPVNT